MRKFQLLTAASIAMFNALSVSAITAEDLAGATYSNPVDATGLIVNAQCDSLGGWTHSPSSWKHNTKSYVNGNDTINTFLEVWVSSNNTLTNYNLSQVIKGLPKGSYRFTVNAIATQQGNANTAPQGVYAIVSQDEDADSTLLSTGNGAPEKFVIDFYNSSDSIKVGVDINNTNCNWVAVDNFTLTYYGESLDLFKGQVTDVIAEINDTISKSGGIYSGLQEELDAAVAAAQAVVDNAASTKDEIIAQHVVMEEYLAKVCEHIDAYAALAAAIEEAGDVLNLDTDIYDISYVENCLAENDYEDILENRTLSTEDCMAVTEELTNACDRTKMSYIHDGDDISSIIVNNSFDDDANGWLGTAPSVQVGVGEAYNKTFDTYQEFNGLPKGLYTLTFNGFFRTNSNPNSYTEYKNGTDDIRAYGYFNDTMVKIVNVMSQAQPERKADSDYETEDGTFVPNDRTGCVEYFNAGLYKNTISGLVVDGKLRIGVKLQNASGYSGYWCPYDNFQLVYNGADLSVMTEFRDNAIAQAEAYYDQIMSAEVKDSLEMFVASIKAAEDIDQFCEAYEELTNAIAAAENSVDLYSQVIDALTVSAAKVDSLKEFAGSYAENYSVVEENVYAGAYSDGEIPDVIAQISKFTNEYLLEGITGSESEPADISFVLRNGDFSEGDNTGWDIATGNSAVSYTCLEFYNCTFDMSQHVYGLPAGKYKLVPQGFYRCGELASIGEDLNVKIFINDTESELQSILDGAVPVEEGPSYGCLTYNEIYSVPNTMQSANYFFDSLSVAKYADSYVEYDYNDPTADFVIGAKKETSVYRDWTIFGRFSLYYMGSTTGIEEIDSSVNPADVVATEYYDVSGMRLNAPAKGLTIVKNKMKDGAVKVRKVVVK